MRSGAQYRSAAVAAERHKQDNMETKGQAFHGVHMGDVPAGLRLSDWTGTAVAEDATLSDVLGHLSYIAISENLVVINVRVAESPEGVRAVGDLVRLERDRAPEHPGPKPARKRRWWRWWRK